MLNREQLADLYRGLQKERILSVYLDGVGEDPARRRVWRRRLAQELDRERERLQLADDEEREAFDAAEEQVLKELDAFQAFLPGKGWVGFAAPDGIRHAETLPVQVPNLVRWAHGPRVALYVRGLKQLRPMVTALVDSRRGRIFLYKEGKLEEVEDLRADTFLGDLQDGSAPNRASHYSGSRGETATDTAHRLLEVGAARMLRRVKEVCCDLVGPDSFLLLGGAPEALAILSGMIPKSLEPRVLENPSLFVEMSLPEVKAATADGASALSKRRQETLLDQVVQLAYARGNGSLGGKETVEALREGRVDILLLSRGFVEANPDFADQCVGMALEHGAEVRVLSGEPGDHLDSEGGGVAARLRYRVEVAVG